MRIENLIPGIFLKRYKRFFVDVQLKDGTVVTAHTNNTGSMKSLLGPGNSVWLEHHDDPKRKLKYTLHLIEVAQHALVCVNTQLPNRLVFEAIQDQKIPEFQKYDLLKKEVKYGEQRSRIDIYLEQNQVPVFIEIKNVTLAEENLPRVAQFPDASTERGRKHLRELALEAEKGHRAVMLYLVNRTDCDSFRLADHIDLPYVQAYEEAVQQGLEVLVYQSDISIHNHGATLQIGKSLPFF